MNTIILIAACIAVAAAAIVEKRPMAGAVVDITHNSQLKDDTIVAAMGLMNTFFKETSNEEVPPRTAVKVIKATSQVVSGVKYHFMLKVLAGSEPEICELDLWQRVWMKAPENYKISNVKCNKIAREPALLGGDDHDYVIHGTSEPQPRKLGGGLLGGWRSVSISSDEMRNPLLRLTNHVNAGSNSMYRMIPVGGTVQKQVVAGIQYKFNNVQWAMTTCRNNQDNVEVLYATSQCPLSNAAIRLNTFSGSMYIPAGKSYDEAQITEEPTTV